MTKVGSTNSMTSTMKTCITTAQRTRGRIKSSAHTSPCLAGLRPTLPSTCKRQRSYQRAWLVVCFFNLAHVGLMILMRSLPKPKNNVRPFLVARRTSTCFVNPLENFTGTTRPNNGSKTGMTTIANSPQSVAHKRAVGLPVNLTNYLKLPWFSHFARA